MDTIRFEVERTDTPARGPVDTVDVFINDRNLVDLAREVELPFASRGGNPNRAGGYVGLPAEAVFLPSRRLLGAPEEGYDDWGGRISILGCGCGAVGCWPLQARTTTTDDRVTWSGFEQPHRKSWRHDRLGPFVFGRSAYEEALRR